jgi:uncharacterized peroxidase-related enzyme
MPRITPIDPDTATGKAKEVLDTVQAAHGRTTNMTRTMARNPGVLEGWFAFHRALGKTLSRGMNEQIAIAVAEANECIYCLSGHTAAGRRVGVDDDELALSRDGESSDPKVAAALGFARAVNAKRGAVSDDDLDRVRAAGWDDADIEAIVAHVGLNVFTNYFNLVTRPVVDFPEIAPGRRGPTLGSQPYAVRSLAARAAEEATRT